MTSSALRRPLSVLLALAVAVVVPVLATGPTEAKAQPRPVEADLRSYALEPEPEVAALGEPGRSTGPGEEAGSMSRVVELGGRAHVVGVTWERGTVSAEAEAEIRERRDGVWGEWQHLETDPEEGPDAGTEADQRGRGGSAPWISTADAVQVRVVGDTVGRGRSARLDVVDAETTAADSALTTGSAGTAAAAATTPTIYTRRDWGADESIRRGTPSYGRVEAAVVHHTVGSNSYTADQVPSIIRGIYSFHVNGRGWNDIGYNFLVDRYGRTWEGRYGGTTQAVVGAHSQGVNSQTTGTSVLGTFDSHTPPTAVITAQAKLIAWKLGLARVDPTGTTYLDGQGTQQTVVGHRDVFSTECPGQRLYDAIGTIRTKARQYQGTMVYAPAVSRTSYAYGGGGVTVTGNPSTLVRWTVTVSSACRPDQQVVLEGSASDRTPIRAAWDGRLADGRLAPPGEYEVTLAASSGSTTLSTALSSTWTLSIGATSGSPAGLCPPRLSGSDRFAVAVAAGRAQDDATRRVVLVNGQENAMADALVAAPLAEHEGAVLLLTNANALPGATSAEIRRREVTDVTIVGGSASVSSAVVQQLRDRGVSTIQRVNGADRYEVAANVATRINPSGGAPDVLVASGTQAAMADGLVLSGPATSLRRPVLLVAADSVPEPTRAALSTLGTRRTVVAGGPATVPQSVLAQLPSPTRLGGADRYEVSSVVASWARGAGVATDSVLVASGRPASLADTLAGGQLGRPTLYVTQDTVPPSVRSWLDKEAALKTVTVMGGTASVSLPVGGRVQQAAAG